MIAFCAWFSSRDESSGIGEPPRGGPASGGFTKLPPEVPHCA
jgi:hypothetical protein